MRLLSAIVIFILATAATALAATRGEGAHFNAWLDSVWEERLVRDPLLATQVGEPRYNDRFVDTTTAVWRDDERRWIERQIKQLKTFDRDALGHAERVSYDILKRRLEATLEGYRFNDWMQPLNQRFSLPNEIAQMGSGQSIQPFRNTKDYDDWHRRLTAAMPVFEGMMANMRAGMASGVTQPRAVMEKVLPQLSDLAVNDPEHSLFWEPLKRFPETVPTADRARITAEYRVLLAERVLPQYKRLLDFVRDEYLPKARTSVAWSDLPDGRAWYAYLVRESTTTDLSPDAIHALGLKEVRRILDEMEAVRREVRFEGDLPAFFKHLQDDPRFYYSRAEDLLEGYRALKTRIDALLPRIFDIAPRFDYEVREVEAFRARSMEGATYQEGSADGSRRGVFYVNTFNLKAQPKFGMETLSLHEASPGHHFQSSIAQAMEGLPKFRRFDTFYVAYVEGWALYCESLGKELGLFTDPYHWYGRLSDEQLRAMRLVVDTGLHHKGWSRQQAIDYMLAHSSMAPSDVEAEVERYIVWPGQALGYKIGEWEIRAMRREAEAALGERFDIKRFHRLVLSGGMLPMDVLRAEVMRWIEGQRLGPTN